MSYIYGKRDLHLRDPKLSEHALLVRWRNENRKWFFNQEEIALEPHLEWYERIKEDPLQEFYVVAVDQKPVGTIGLIRRGSHASEYGRFLIADPFKRRGYGRAALRALLWHAFDTVGVESVYGRILADNERAISLVESLGFSQMPAWGSVNILSAVEYTVVEGSVKWD